MEKLNLTLTEETTSDVGEINESVEKPDFMKKSKASISIISCLKILSL